jgi:hypothetical protein
LLFISSTNIDMQLSDLVLTSSSQKVVSFSWRAFPLWLILAFHFGFASPRFYRVRRFGAGPRSASS